MKISIFGLGYVGAVSAGCLARDGHTVVGCDIDPAKLDLITQGKTPIIEAGMVDLMKGAADSGRLTATNDANAAIHGTDISFVCVGTPTAKGGGQNLTALKRLSEQLGEALATKADYHVIVIRSTVIPRTVEDVVKPIIEEHSGKKAGEDFGLCFQPEFLREGSSIADYDKPPFTVVGVADDRPAAMLEEVFGHLPCDFVTTTIEAAEMLKFCCNVFHALKITFANEVGRISQAMNVDGREVMRLLCLDQQLNISKAYLRPGFAFGGSCLPKDTRALTHFARTNHVDVPMLAGIMSSNQFHVDHAVTTVLETKKRNVGMIGLSFKSGTDDLRESPLVTIAERFIGKGLNLEIFDPEVSMARLIGANRRYIEETIPHIGSLMKPSVEEVIRRADVLIVGLSDKDLIDAVYEHHRPDHVVLDLVSLDQSRIRCTYHGACW